MRRIGDQSDEQATIDQIRINVAFEEMVVSVLAGAGVGGALTFVLSLARTLMGGFSFLNLTTLFLESLLVSILIFLIGFGASVIFGASLFAALEKRKRRNVWPYLGAATGVAIAVFVLLAIGVPGAGTIDLKAFTAIFTPALVVAFVFARRMQPHWRAAEKAEAEALAPIVFRIH